MSAEAPRQATTITDAALAGRLLHAFNTEYEDPTPGPDALAARITELTHDGDTAVLLSGEVGVAVLRFHKSLWETGLEVVLAELYVTPDHRGQGYGSALLRACLDHARARGAVRAEIVTSEDDVAARRLYERSGFVRTEGVRGPLMFCYERDL